MCQCNIVHANLTTTNSRQVAPLDSNSSQIDHVNSRFCIVVLTRYHPRS